MTADLLVVEDLVKYSPVTRGIVFQKEVASVKAVDGTGLHGQAGETLGVVGESGCGKSTMARCIMRSLDPGQADSSTSTADITHLSRTEMRPIRRELMMIFQDPYASLNQRKRSASSSPRRSRCTRSGRRPRSSGACRSCSIVVAFVPGALQPLSARVLRRPAAADRCRPRARGQPEADRLRRAGVGARRLGAGADPQPAQ